MGLDEDAVYCPLFPFDAMLIKWKNETPATGTWKKRGVSIHFGLLIIKY
jgi:hypothetical protein